MTTSNYHPSVVEEFYRERKALEAKLAEAEEMHPVRYIGGGPARKDFANRQQYRAALARWRRNQ